MLELLLLVADIVMLFAILYVVELLPRDGDRYHRTLLLLFCYYYIDAKVFVVLRRQLIALTMHWPRKCSSTVQWWFKKFCKGDENLEDEQCAVR